MYMLFTDNPVADAENYYEQKDRELDKLPICDICGYHIQEDHYYNIDGLKYCPDCIQERKCYVEDY